MSEEERKNASRKGGKVNAINKTGVCGRSKEKMTEDGKKGGKISGRKSYENKTGIFSLTKEERRQASHKGGKRGGVMTANQKWKCLETGFITNAGNLTKYQKARGIDTSKRVKLNSMTT